MPPMAANKGQRVAACQPRFLLRCQNLMNFFFIHLCLSYPSPHHHPPPPLHTLLSYKLRPYHAFSFYLFYFLRILRNLPVCPPLLLLPQRTPPRPACCCVLQHFSNQSAPSSDHLPPQLPHPAPLRIFCPFKCGSLITWGVSEGLTGGVWLNNATSM